MENPKILVKKKFVPLRFLPFSISFIICLENGKNNKIKLSADSVLQSVLFTANSRKVNEQHIFLFQNLTFTVWLMCILKLSHFGEGRNLVEMTTVEVVSGVVCSVDYRNYVIKRITSTFLSHLFFLLLLKVFVF